jgi:hypothetical protein
VKEGTCSRTTETSRESGLLLRYQKIFNFPVLHRAVPGHIVERGCLCQETRR